MRKKGQLKLQRHKRHTPKQKQPIQQEQVEYSSESEQASGDEFGDMLDDEEQQYLMSRLAKQPSLLANVPEEEKQNKLVLSVIVLLFCDLKTDITGWQLTLHA